MADKVIRVDDLDGTTTDDVERYTFTWQGADYEIDLSPKSAKKLTDTMATFASHGRRLNGTAPTASTKRTRLPSEATSNGGSKEALQALRAWARAQGMEVSSRGRVSTAIREAYEAAQAGTAAPE